MCIGNIRTDFLMRYIKLMQTIQDSEMKNKMLMIWDKCKLCERNVYSEPMLEHRSTSSQIL